MAYSIDLSGRVAFVTGASSGLGAQFAKVLSRSGAAVVHMTKAFALEWGRFGINVNALCPGYIDTEINHHHWQTEQGQKLVQMLPRKRVGKPEDLDAALLMLASDRSHFINGAIISADDGFSL